MSQQFDWIVRGGTVVSASSLEKQDVAVADGKIVEIAPELDPALAHDVFDAAGKLVFPGIIDSHNHPYYDDDIEAFSLSAAYGGVTTLLSFAGRPLWLPQTDVLQMVSEFIADGSRRSYLDFGLHVILTPNDDFEGALPSLFSLGITSYKVFLAFAREKRMMPDDRLLDLMERLAARGGISMVHCENGLAIDHLEQRARARKATTPADYVSSRPPALESEAVYRALSLAETANCDCYIVHISAAESMNIVDRFRERNGPMRYAETCTHYLTLDHNEQERIGGRAKISPPMREQQDIESLWDRLRDGAIDVIASDGSGRTKAAKAAGEPDIFSVISGIPGVEQMFPIVFNEVTNRALPLTLLARVFCENPARIFDLEDKGRLEVGYDADIAVFDPGLGWTIRAEDQHGNSDFSVYEGRQLLGRAVFTMQRGRPLLKDGTVNVEPGAGRFLARGQMLDIDRISSLAQHHG